MGYWIEKSEKEIKDERSKYVVEKDVIIIGMVVYFLGLIFWSLIEKFGFSDNNALPWIEVLKRLPIKLSILMFVPILFIIIAYFFNDGSFSHHNTMLCKMCNKVKLDDSIEDCECGGYFVNIKKMKWIEDKVDTNSDDIS